MQGRYGLIAAMLALIGVGVAYWLATGGPAPEKPKQAVQTPPAKPSADPPKTRVDAAPPADATKPPPPSKPLAAPSFDIVRVGPDGRAVLAGKGSPGASISVLDGGREIGKTTADGNGEWVIVPDKPLAPGTRELAVHADAPGAPTQVGDKLVVIKVPEPKDGGQPIVVAVPTKQGDAAVLQLPAGVELARSGDLQVVTLDREADGTISIAGKAPSGRGVRAYVDNALLGAANADAQSNWRLRGKTQLTPGAHALRLDMVDKDGKVLARLELKLDGGAPQVAGGTGAKVSIAQGDNLWTIAQKLYGSGDRYTLIFEANKGQIRDPNLIYPGQIFVLPPAR